MLQKKEPIIISEFNKGLFTKGNILTNEKGNSPDCMDVKWNFDTSVQKRLGSILRGSVPTGAVTTGTGWVLNSQSNMTTGLSEYWKMDEPSGTRYGQQNSANLTQVNNVGYASGVRSQAANIGASSSQFLFTNNAKGIETSSDSFTVGGWFYLNSTSNIKERVIVCKQDPDFSSSDPNTVLLLHCDGADASTTFTDSSGASHAVSANVNAQIDTAQKKFGTASGLFDGSSYLTSVDSADWDFGTGDFTIDFWVYFNSLGVGHHFINRDYDGSSNGFLLEWSSASGGILAWQAGGPGIFNRAWSPATGQWYHIALTRSSGTDRLFVDGTQLGASASDTTDINYTSGLVIGASGTGTRPLNGWMDEIRISKGIARWTTDFSVPTSAYQTVTASKLEYCVYVGTDNYLTFRASSSGVAFNGIVKASSAGTINTATWYNFVAWHLTGGFIGLCVSSNGSILNIDTAAYTSGVRNNSAPFCVGGISGSTTQFFDGYIDELAYWKKPIALVGTPTAVLSDFYGGTSGNTYLSGAESTVNYGWGIFDFGASSLRWLVCAAGTGLYASSDMGLSYVAISTSRTSYYQGFERSKNVLICTSDAYDPTLYWAGSVGSYCSTLALNSAPAAKFAINYQGFLILLNTKDSNSTISKRQFSYADESLQLTSPWTTFFSVPSSADDEITAAFVVNRILYVSTRYRIFRISYVGGNPDWSYQVMQEWGYVPRTTRRAIVKGIPHEVVIGLDWSRRIRMFDGINSVILSDNVESDNGICDFAMAKVSYFGSGVAISNAEFDPLEQEYRLNVAIGPTSTQTTHAILFNARTLAMYPYSRQFYQSMCVAESNNRQYLMAIDRSARVYTLNTGFTDDGTPINEHYDSAYLYNKTPDVVNKGGILSMFFKPTSAGTVYFQDRVDFSDVYSTSKKLEVGSGGGTQVTKTIDLPYTYNIYQFRLSSSSSTTEPWNMTHAIIYEQMMGIGKGQ